MRQALALAIEQGEGRTAAVLYNNLGMRRHVVRRAEKPTWTLLREGIAFCGGARD